MEDANGTRDEMGNCEANSKREEEKRYNLQTSEKIPKYSRNECSYQGATLTRDEREARNGTGNEDPVEQQLLSGIE